MSTPLARAHARLQLKKPAPPGGAPPGTPPGGGSGGLGGAPASSRPSVASSATARGRSVTDAAPPRGEAPSAYTPPPCYSQPTEPPVTDFALKLLRAKAAQLERQVVLATSDVKARDCLVADAVAAVNGIRAHAASAAGARSLEEAQSALRELDAYARAAVAKCLAKNDAATQDEPQWEVPFTPAGGNKFLTPAPASCSFGGNGGDGGVTVTGAAWGEARSMIQGAKVAELEEHLCSLAPELDALAARLTGEVDLGLADAAMQVDTVARALAQLAALSPTRGFLFGAAAQPRRGAPPARKPGAKAAPGAAPPARRAGAAAGGGSAAGSSSSAAAASVSASAAKGRLPDVAMALSMLPPFAPGREVDGRDSLARLLRDAAAAEAAWASEREGLRAELAAARAGGSAGAFAPPAPPQQRAAFGADDDGVLRAAAGPLRRVLAAGAAVESAPSETTLKSLVAVISGERPYLDAALRAIETKARG
jgi:hypothetical protein